MIPAEAEEEGELSSLLSHLKICANNRDYLGSLDTKANQVVWNVSCMFQIIWMVPEELMKRVS
jgi:hypothetical protein